MRRTQLYLEERDPEERKKALLSAIGIWKDRTDLPDTETYVRRLRKDTRWKRLWR